MSRLWYVCYTMSRDRGCDLHRCVTWWGWCVSYGFVTAPCRLCLQKKEPVGDDDTLPDSVTSKLAQLTADELRPLTVTQLKVSTP